MPLIEADSRHTATGISGTTTAAGTVFFAGATLDDLADSALVAILPRAHRRCCCWHPDDTDQDDQRSSCEEPLQHFASSVWLNAARQEPSFIFSMRTLTFMV